MAHSNQHLILVAGAGPAGMAVAAMMAKHGHEVIILNRDIKFGGLAEYGIFPSKLKLRGGLKKTYRELLSNGNVHYFGNVSVGQGKDVTLDELRSLGFSAIVFATGAQGTKTIGVEGDTAKGVYHAKDVVFHFNRLPGYGDQPFEMGRHVAVIGVGDVMVDIAHWLTRYKKVERVTAIARRGPVERKYNPKEIRAVCANIHREDLAKEIGRIGPRLEAVGQKPDEALRGMVDELVKCEPSVSQTRMGFRFLASPKRVLVDSHNRVRALELEETKLEPKGNDTAAVGLKQYYEFPCDSVVFAVGDKVDQSLGLPYKNGVFVTNPTSSGLEPDDAQFQAYDEVSGKILDGVFLAGWARKASEGLVGVAKRDGDWCAEVVQRYLTSKPGLDRAHSQRVVDRLRALLRERGVSVVGNAELDRLEAGEKEHGPSAECIGEFKFLTNQDMLGAIDKKKGPSSRA